MSVLERRMLTLALIFGILTASVAAAKALNLGAWQAPVTRASSNTYYGANEAYVAAGAAQWPQSVNNWCGVANIEVIANYTYQLVGGINDTPFLSGGQQRIATDLDSSSAVSEWGTPSPNGIGPGFKADIARDGGTDPRSIAWGIEYESTVGSYWRFLHSGNKVPPPIEPTLAFHDVILHGNASNSVANLEPPLAAFQIPLSVTIAHGLHSDVVSGVYSLNNPLNVDAVTAWDPAVGSPGGGYQSAREVTWDNYSFNNNTNMWGSAYSSNNGYDPDPSVGIYTPTSQYPSHWIGFRTAIEPDHLVNVDPDFALDDSGNVMKHP